jgi:AcrR family transcriptional regulator
MQAANTPVPKLPGARERILLTAHELFYREGIRATGIDRVIGEAGVTKATFYRHFPSKNDLVLEFLEYRHRHWMAWFVDALRRHGNAAEAISPALAEWFGNAGFRGCAFINSLGELAATLPEIVEVTRNHKREMTSVIAGLLPSSRRRKQDAEALALAVDGAIIRAQFDQTPAAALAGLERILNSLLAAGNVDTRRSGRRGRERP